MAIHQVCIAHSYFAYLVTISYMIYEIKLQYKLGINGIRDATVKPSVPLNIATL